MGGCSAKKPAPGAQQSASSPVAPTLVDEPKRPKKAAGRFKIMLAGDWKDYDAEEDAVLKKAYLVGHPNTRFELRGNKYEYNFTKMKQMNLKTKKERDIRAPSGMRPPDAPVLPSGPMTVITVRPGQAGKTIEINNPNNPGSKVQVVVPPGAKPGQKMAVPLPKKGESVSDVQKKQKELSTRAKVARAGAATVGVAGIAVGGVILGDHLAGGTMGADAVAAAGEALAPAGEAIGDAAGEVGKAMAPVGEALAPAGEWISDAAGKVGEALAPAGEAIGDAAEDAGEWFADAADDVGDFIMDMF